jgi:hypothetical protein
MGVALAGREEMQEVSAAKMYRHKVGGIDRLSDRRRGCIEKKDPMTQHLPGVGRG